MQGLFLVGREVLDQALVAVAGHHEHPRAVDSDFLHIRQRQQRCQEAQPDEAVQHALSDPLWVDQPTLSVHRRCSTKCHDLAVDQGAELTRERRTWLEQLGDVEPPCQLVAHLTPDLTFGGQVWTGLERGVRERTSDVVVVSGISHGRLPCQASGRSVRGKVKAARIPRLGAFAGSKFVARRSCRDSSTSARAAEPRRLPPKAISGRCAASLRRLCEAHGQLRHNRGGAGAGVD